MVQALMNHWVLPTISPRLSQRSLMSSIIQLAKVLGAAAPPPFPARMAWVFVPTFRVSLDCFEGKPGEIRANISQ